MKKNIPIYLGDITVSLVNTAFGKSVLVKEKVLKREFIKGFTFNDMIKRRKEKWSSMSFPAGAKKNEKIIIKKIHLISQHGFGVDE